MSRGVWREELAGSALGVFFMAVFGFVWASLGTASLPGSSVLLVVSAVVSLALIAAGFYLRRVARSASPMPLGMRRPGMMNRFRMVFLIEGVAIAVAVFVLNLVGRPELVPAVVALIVGVHFFPLAPLFRVREYHLTGALLCLVFLLTVVISTLSGSENVWLVVPGVGSALVLWGTGAFLAVSRVRGLRVG